MSDSTAKHTAGEWEVTAETVFEDVRVYGGTEQRTTTVGYSIEANGVWIAGFGSSMGLEESLANARVGAAGPKMLAALKEIRTLIDSAYHQRGRIAEICEAAIAAAEGR